ncbi:hypothetical protein AGMMS50267_08240 [Spirochaetia bacterium]|nr:hypothetical protein AGMMS50267_08240 [Spirochaetia bacterium]
MDKKEAQTQCRNFAVKIVQLYRHLSNNKKEAVLSEQLLRSGTGIGANLAKADCAINKNEYLTRLYSALQDCAETKYWLDVLNASGVLTEFEYNSHTQDCDTLQNMFLLAIKSLRAAINPGAAANAAVTPAPAAKQA